ncbi:transglutaminase-like cysteine peptidase [Psychrobium sp. MM17-31]|uniref:transglutaminase-like cysteine peptidase n=1 Tax=Psychrobium sp. MM17-31 TaxID=2917758 RepID=UPI001EF5A0DA|nr:transglutaminase-like cysteine peptidase [Psychrobium sp. MM17-31]MCG7533289.1 transglutaminase-like cysteine peptidase [Psychrobium sp. MM17-31]
MEPLQRNKGMKWPLKLALVSSLLTFGLYAKSGSNIDNQKVIEALKKNYGERAGKRGNAWVKILTQDKALSERDKLEKVNRFFNYFRFVDDIKLWGVKNYWATPIEFIGVNGGDCEDYSIAKYYTLLELGVPDEKMRITMVKALRLNQYHMVLAYYETPASVPLILDNIDGKIKPATQRSDLLPVYSFNGTQLWLNKEKGRGVLAGDSKRLKRWTSLKQRLGVNNLKQPKLKLE